MENEFKNLIISISGTPVSGKSTTIKEIINQLIEQGYENENIHLVSTGSEFRKYFNSVIELLNALDDMTKLKELSQRDELKRIFQDEKYRKSFETAILELKKQEYSTNKFSIEKANNSQRLKPIRDIIDSIIDSDIRLLGEKVNEEPRQNEVWLVDSRLAFHNIPSSFAVRLTVDNDVAAKRLYDDKSRGSEDSNYQSLEEAKKATIKRRNGEVERYKARYGVDLENAENYNMIIDTSYSDVKDIAKAIIQCAKCEQKGEPYGKFWTSPKTLLPLQEERDTLGGLFYTFDDIIKSISTNGYYPDEEIEVVNVDGANYIIEGHHRNFGAAYTKKTLVPYKVLAKNDETIPGFRNTARQRAESLSRRILLSHEHFFGSDFSYKNTFPKVFKEVSARESR